MNRYYRVLTRRRDLTYHVEGCRHLEGKDAVEVSREEVERALKAGRFKRVSLEHKLVALNVCLACWPAVEPTDWHAEGEPAWSTGPLPEPAVEAQPFFCAECGTHTASTYVVTGAVDDRDGRTEVCLACHTALAGQPLLPSEGTPEEGHPPLAGEVTLDELMRPARVGNVPFTGYQVRLSHGGEELAVEMVLLRPDEPPSLAALEVLADLRFEVQKLNGGVETVETLGGDEVAAELTARALVHQANEKRRKKR